MPRHHPTPRQQREDFRACRDVRLLPRRLRHGGQTPDADLLAAYPDAKAAAERIVRELAKGLQAAELNASQLHRRFRHPLHPRLLARFRRHPSTDAQKLNAFYKATSTPKILSYLYRPSLTRSSQLTYELRRRFKQNLNERDISQRKG